MYLIDTDIVIFWLRGKFDLKLRADLLPAGSLKVSVMTVAELSFGAHNSDRVDFHLSEIDRVLKVCEVIPCDLRAALKYGKIRAELEEIGEGLSDPDMLIAATALTNDLILVTNNLHHFERVPALRFENWIKE